MSWSFHVAGNAAAHLRASRRPLVAALALSALLHASLLTAVRLRPAPQQPVPPVTLTIVSLRAQDPGPFAQPGVVQPADAPAPAPAPPTEAVTTPSRPAERSEAPASPKPSVPEDTTFHPAEELSPRPRPLAQPEFAPAVLEQLRGRRLQLEVWVGPGGEIKKSELRTGELSPQLKDRLLDAVERARFVPGQLKGKAVGSILRLRLCYDESGLADDSEQDCWAALARVRD